MEETVHSCTSRWGCCQAAQQHASVHSATHALCRHLLTCALAHTRPTGQFSRRACEPALLAPQLGIIRSHRHQLLQPFADAGYTVEVFLAGYKCVGASGRAMNRALIDAYSPFPVDAVWMERQPPCHQRCNRSIGWNDQHSNAVATLFAQANHTAAEGGAPPALTIMIRVDMNLTTSVLDAFTAAQLSAKGAEKLYVPWMLRLGPAEAPLSRDSVSTDALFIVPRKVWKPFACTICDPGQCFGSCEASLGIECQGCNHGHNCHSVGFLFVCRHSGWIH